LDSARKDGAENTRHEAQGARCEDLRALGYPALQLRRTERGEPPVADFGPSNVLADQVGRTRCGGRPMGSRRCPLPCIFGQRDLRRVVYVCAGELRAFDGG